MKYALLLLFIFLTSSCKDLGVDPAVDTLRITAKGIKADVQTVMASELYEHYINSDKSKEFYEVIAEPRGEILNYHPVKQILTPCGDPGSNWGSQIKGVDLKTLKRIGDSRITFEMYYDSLTWNPSSEYLKVKTNGHPSDLYGK